MGPARLTHCGVHPQAPVRSATLSRRAFARAVHTIHSPDDHELPLIIFIVNQRRAQP
jgi:hypothetical protein